MERLCLNCMKIYSIKSEYEKMNGQCPYCGFDDNTPPKDGMHLPPGTILNNKYIVGTVIGAGGFGATYRGWDNTLARVVAIKEYLPKGLVVRQGKELVVKSELDYEFLQKGIKRTLMEARSIVRFNDESAITNIYEFFEENGTAYIVMEYLEGCNLREYSKNYKEILPFDMIMNLAVSICDVLDVVHKENIVHRDISPDNIFYCSKKKIYKLIDFGAVKQVDSSYMQSSTIYLKHGFAPIEQYSGSGQVGPWTDIYAFGATLYVLSTGKMPAPSVDRIGEDTLVAPKKIKSSLPIEFSDAILKAMAVQARDRFKNAGEFKNALLKCVQKNEDTYSEEQHSTEKTESHNHTDTEPYKKNVENHSGFTEYQEDKENKNKTEKYNKKINTERVSEHKKTGNNIDIAGKNVEKEHKTDFEKNNTFYAPTYISSKLKKRDSAKEKGSIENPWSINKKYKYLNDNFVEKFKYGNTWLYVQFPPYPKEGVYSTTVNGSKYYFEFKSRGFPFTFVFLFMILFFFFVGIKLHVEIEELILPVVGETCMLSIPLYLVYHIIHLIRYDLFRKIYNINKKKSKEVIKRIIICFNLSVSLGILVLVLLVSAVAQKPRNIWSKIRYPNEAIKWRILSLDDDGRGALIISDQIIDNQRYNSNRVEITWKDCFIRKWLNYDFYNAAFESEERKSIISTNVINAANPEFGIMGCEDTNDNIFLLSLDEVKNVEFGFIETEDDSSTRESVSARYVNDVKSKKIKVYQWWLRSPGDSSYDIAYVNVNGKVISEGSFSNYTNGIRPAMHIDISSSYVSDAGEVDSKGNVTNNNDGYNSPKTNEDGTVIWDCIYFGNYPQNKTRY